MVQTRSRDGEVKVERTRPARHTTPSKKKTEEVKKSGSSIKKKTSPNKKSPVKLLLKSSPGRTTYTSRLRGSNQLFNCGVDNNEEVNILTNDITSKLTIKNDEKTTKTPIKKVIAKNPSPIKNIVLKASPGRSTYSSRTRTPSRIDNNEEKKEETRPRTRKNLHVLDVDDLPSSSLSIDSAISSSCESSTKSPSLSSPTSSSYGSSREDDCTSTPCDTVSSSTHTPIVPLKGREKEYATLLSLIDKSIESNQPLTIYISGTPGTGKSATTRLILEELALPPRKIKSTMVNCTSLRTSDDVCGSAMKNIGKACTSGAHTKFKSFVSSLRHPFVLVLDEADFVSEKALTSIFTMPSTVSSHLIVIGIANTIDFTERVLKKIKLRNEPRLLVFGRYSKEQLATILHDKMIEEGEEVMDSTSLALCAGRVAAVSGDLRMAMDLVRQSSKRMMRDVKEKELQEKNMMDGEQSNVDGAVVPPSTPHSSRETALRAINCVYRTVYSSPLARARLPLQPRVLLAVCLRLSTTTKKKSLTRSGLVSAYNKACTSFSWPMASGEDLDSAIDLISSQSFISVQGDQIRLQVDATTARSAICDNDLLRKIESLQLN